MRRTQLLIGAGAVALVFLLLGCVLTIPHFLVRRDLGRYDPGTAKRLTQAEYLKTRNDVRTTLLQGFGGLLVLIGAGLGASVGFGQIKVSQGQLQATRDQIRQAAEQSERQLLISREQLQQNFQTSQRELEIGREGQITDRFTRAIDQLGSNTLDVRLGGIYALERIAKDSPPDREPIAEVLTAYVREHAPRPTDEVVSRIRNLPPLRLRAADIQAILDILGRYPDKSLRFNLSRVDLRKAELEGTDLRNVELEKAWLQAANLRNACLEGARLYDAQLQGADLQGANLCNAYLIGADLGDLIEHETDAGLQEDPIIIEGEEFVKRFTVAGGGAAILSKAKLAGADLGYAKVESAGFDGATATPSTRWPEGFNPQAAGVIIEDG